MFSEDCAQTAPAASVAVSAEPVGATIVQPAKGARSILIAEEPRDLSPTVVAMAQELCAALGFGVRMLPSIPAQNHEDRLDIILRYAALPDVALVIRGSPPRKKGGRHPFWHQLLRRCPRPLLLVGPRGRKPGIVAASDCSDPSLPVIREAAIVASALLDFAVPTTTSVKYSNVPESAPGA